MMKKEQIMEHAIELLKSFDLNDVEKITVETDTYTDGSNTFEVQVDFFCRKGGDDD